MPNWNAITESDLQRMIDLRDKGLSNSQIAIEMGRSYKTVVRYLGKQPTMLRADYGAIKTHSTGETFVKNPPEEADIPPEKRKPSAIKLQRTVFTFSGYAMDYKLSSEGEVRISTRVGSELTFQKDDFYRFLSELCDIGEFMGKMNAVEKT